jgi:hypothetical protein
VQKALNVALRRTAIVDTGREQVTVTLVQAYGEAFRSTQRKPKHNGQSHASVIFSLRLEVAWHGRVELGATTLGSASGKIKLGEIDVENWNQPQRWDASVRLDCEPGANQAPPQPQTTPPQQPQQAPELDPSELELRLKALVSEQGVEAVRGAVREVVERLLVQGGLEETEQLARRQAREQLREREQAERLAEHEQRERELGLVADLRRQLMGKEYLRVADGLAAGSTQWALRLCSIADRDVPALCAQVSASPALKEIDLYFNQLGDRGLGELCEAVRVLPQLETLDLRNNQIGDAGVQTLVAMLAMGGAPALKVVRLEANPNITAMGKTILGTLKLLRKGVELRVD